jgi:hypothetical protein
LAGDENRAPATTAVEEFEEAKGASACARAEWRIGEVIDRREVDFGDGGEALAADAGRVVTLCAYVQTCEAIRTIFIPLP